MHGCVNRGILLFVETRKFFEYTRVARKGMWLARPGIHARQPEQYVITYEAGHNNNTTYLILGKPL